jgi:excisionase family DNA binding protein
MAADVQPAPLPQFLTVHEVARALNVSRRTVSRLVEARKIPAVRTGCARRAHLRIPRAALDRLVADAQAPLAVNQDR